MALKNCNECSKPVSTSADVCPHCGCKHPTLNWQLVKISMAICAAGGLVILLILILAARS